MSAGVQLRIGTSGWVYKHWIGIFYPRGLSGAGQLRFYAARFDTVEVNFSFYRLPERTVFEQWRAQTPDDFLFAVKGSRYLTHMKKLNDPDEPLHRLLDRAEGLGEKFCLPVDPGLPLAVRLTAPWTYIRMHQGQRGTGYTDGELEVWARHIRSFQDQQADTYVYFNNDPEGHAIRDAERLRLLLS